MKRSGKKRTLDQVLQSCFDNFFDDETDEAAMVKIESKDLDGGTPLHIMAWRNNRISSQILIENGANVNAIDDMGETPLHIAVSQKNEQIIVMLLKAGAVTNIRSVFGETAHEGAVKTGGKINKLFK